MIYPCAFNCQSAGAPHNTRPAPMYPPERNSMSHSAPGNVLFERAGVRVTASRFETGFATFQIKKISAVRVDVEKHRLRIGVPLAIAGLAGLIVGALTNIPLFIVAGAAFTVGGTIMCFAKVNRCVVLTMRGEDVKTFTSKDAALVQDLIAALQTAIAQRSDAGN